MANLKSLRLRIKSVQSTKKITSAMKMISAAKLKKAQQAAESSRPYAREMATMMQDLVANQPSKDNAPRLLAGTGQDKRHLIVLVTSNRGLCGGFNATIARQVKRLTKSLLAEGKTVQLIIVGQKGKDLLRTDYGSMILGSHLFVTNPRFFNAEGVAADIIDRFEKNEFDVCTLVYNKFITTLTQELTTQQLIPFKGTIIAETGEEENHTRPTLSSIYEYEPSQEDVLAALLPRNIKVQLFSALLESTASEHAARMAAMDGATRNAQDIIGKLQLTYNRTRQAVITNELIEIISGAAALK